jgi:signal transduction histidine kinase
MPSPATEIISQTIAISTLFLLLVGAFATRYVFLYQRKRFVHQQEMMELKEAFSHTLLQSKLEIQEQTLDHIAKELHANVGHLVSLIQIGLEELSMQTSGKAKENTLETQGLTKQLFSELRALNASLNTDLIMHIGFVQALNNELIRLGTAKKYRISFNKTGQEYRLRPEHEIILFRLCQEVLNNVAKHAEAKALSITLNYSPAEFVLEIADDGKGFNVEQALEQSGEKSSTGLINIQKRARIINGTVHISSSPGNGTTFIISIKKDAIQTASI